MKTLLLLQYQRGNALVKCLCLQVNHVVPLLKQTKIQLSVLSRQNDFDDIISENPVINKHFNKLLAERIDEQNIKNIDLKEHEIALSKHLQKAKKYQYSSIVWKSRKMRDVSP